MSTVAHLLEDMLRSEVVDAPDVARVLGTSSRSVARWASAGSMPRRENEERLLELKAVIDALTKVLREEPARLWLRSPIPALDYEKPIDLIERGEYRRVIGAILALAEGVTA
jgi:putative toxin-antitoxin system antitoxin component (TIGR02293 family)